MPLSIEQSDGGVRFPIKVVPGSSRDRVMGLLGDAIKVAVSKPASAGQANEAVIETLANFFGVKTKSISIVRGHSSAQKVIEIVGIDLLKVESKLKSQKCHPNN